MGFEFSLLSYNSTLPFCVISDIVVTPPPPQYNIQYKAVICIHIKYNNYNKCFISKSNIELS